MTKCLSTPYLAKFLQNLLEVWIVFQLFFLFPINIMLSDSNQSLVVEEGLKLLKYRAYLVLVVGKGKIEHETYKKRRRRKHLKIEYILAK